MCDSVHRGGVSASVHAGIHTPLEQTPHWEQTPPGSRHPPEQTPPQSSHRACWEIRSTHGSRHPPGADAPWEQTPPRAATPPRSRPPQEQPHPPGSRHPPRCRACWEIRSTRGRYASYWNAILFNSIFRSKSDANRTRSIGNFNLN